MRDTEKPNRAAAVVPTLRAVTRPAPSARTPRSLKRLDRMVHAEISMATIPAWDTETENPSYMLGHADPNRESGSPRLMKDR